MMALCEKYPNACFPMMGLHPTSVKNNYTEELEVIRRALDQHGFIAIGEIGIDLYWDRTFQKEQEEAFRLQLRWAKEKALPVVIHSRDSFSEIFKVMDEESGPDLTGVFHSFTGNREEAEKALSYNFYIGINGIVTFKNSRLANVVEKVPLERLLIETDSPYLAPVPFRGKRNESGYVTEVADRIASLHQVSPYEIAEITTVNALKLFHKAS
jgi:TatD DNase family protein